MSGEARHRWLPMGVVTVAMALLLSGASALTVRDHGDEAPQVVRAASAGTGVSTTVPPPSSTTSTSTTTAPSSTTTTARAKETDASVVALQRRLAELGYDVGTADGAGGWRTYFAISAFQRVEGLSRTGQDSPSLRAALAEASPPGPMVPGGEANRVEVDLDRQVLFLWQGGRRARILPVSTGSGERYCVDGRCERAITPTGSFRIGRKYPGTEVSRLGQLFHPSYFYGGIAIHGSPSVPAGPASHGCVRIPMYAAASFYDQVPTGMRVYVVGHGTPASAVAPPPDEPVRVSTPAPPQQSTESPPTAPATTPPTAPPTTASPTSTAPPTTDAPAPPSSPSDDGARKKTEGFSRSGR